MTYRDDNSAVWEIDHEARMDQEARDLAWQGLHDFVRRNRSDLFIIHEHWHRIQQGRLDPFYGRIDERVAEFAKYHRDYEFYLLLTQVARERAEHAA